MVSIAGVIAITLIYKVMYALQAKLRLLLCLGNDKQQYWATPKSDLFPTIKSQILWAPLFRKRHNREFQLSRAINVGTLPTRFQGIFLLAFIGLNVAYCTVSIDWSQPRASVLAEFRNRTGVLSTINMVPLFLLAGRNNPLIGLLRISFDTYNLIHRWLGRIVVLEALAHSIAHIIIKVESSKWNISTSQWHEANRRRRLGSFRVQCQILAFHSDWFHCRFFN